MGRIINLLTFFVNIIHVKLADQQGLFLGLNGRWRVPKNAVSAACREVRFKLFRSVTFDPEEACAPLYSLPAMIKQIQEPTKRHLVGIVKLN